MKRGCTAGVPGGRSAGRHVSCRPYWLFAAMLCLLCACSTPHESRPFFLGEENLEKHGRKTVFDRLYQFDPGRTSFTVADDYQENPPKKIAVLPFADQGDGEYLLNKVPITGRSGKDLDRWSWTHANRVRRAVAGALATREFIVVTPFVVDAVLAAHGIDNTDKLNAVPPQTLGFWLGADTVVYGDLLAYEAYYAFLVAAWRVTAEVRMVSTVDGHEVFTCTNSRYSTDVAIVFDPVDIVVNSVLALLQLRDIWLARTEDEVGHEIILRLPPSERALAEIRTLAGKTDGSPPAPPQKPDKPD